MPCQLKTDVSTAVPEEIDITIQFFKEKGVLQLDVDSTSYEFFAGCEELKALLGTDEND